jgi:gas vesicle protein
MLGFDFSSTHQEDGMSDNDSNGFLWFLAGLGIGAGIGILYAPKSGRETREAIWQAAEDGRETVTTRARQAKEQASQYVDRGKQYMEAQKEQIKSAFEAGKQAYREATEAEKPSKA